MHRSQSLNHDDSSRWAVRKAPLDLELPRHARPTAETILLGYGVPVDRSRSAGLESANVSQSIALTGDLSIHGIGCQIDLAGPRNRTIINEHLIKESLVP